MLVHQREGQDGELVRDEHVRKPQLRRSLVCWGSKVRPCPQLSRQVSELSSRRMISFTAEIRIHEVRKVQPVVHEHVLHQIVLLDPQGSVDAFGVTLVAGVADRREHVLGKDLDELVRPFILFRCLFREALLAFFPVLAEQLRVQEREALLQVLGAEALWRSRDHDLPSTCPMLLDDVPDALVARESECVSLVEHHQLECTQEAAQVRQRLPPFLPYLRLSRLFGCFKDLLQDLVGGERDFVLVLTLLLASTFECWQHLSSILGLLFDLIGREQDLSNISSGTFLLHL